MRIYPFALALVLYPSLALAEQSVHDGKWDITSSTSFGGMGGAPQTRTQCLTKKDPVPKHDSPRAKNCKVLDQKIAGGTVSWTMTCDTAHGPIQGTGKITYVGETFDGNLTFTMNDPRGGGTPMTVTTTMQGKRVGECDAAN